MFILYCPFVSIHIQKYISSIDRFIILNWYKIQDAWLAEVPLFFYVIHGEGSTDTGIIIIFIVYIEQNIFLYILYAPE